MSEQEQAPSPDELAEWLADDRGTDRDLLFSDVLCPEINEGSLSMAGVMDWIAGQGDEDYEVELGVDPNRPEESLAGRVMGFFQQHVRPGHFDLPEGWLDFVQGEGV
jgi:hypothetical protein